MLTFQRPQTHVSVGLSGLKLRKTAGSHTPGLFLPPHLPCWLSPPPPPACQQRTASSRGLCREQREQNPYSAGVHTQQNCSKRRSVVQKPWGGGRGGRKSGGSVHDDGRLGNRAGAAEKAQRQEGQCGLRRRLTLVGAAGDLRRAGPCGVGQKGLSSERATHQARPTQRDFLQQHPDPTCPKPQFCLYKLN